MHTRFIVQLILKEQKLHKCSEYGKSFVRGLQEVFIVRHLWNQIHDFYNTVKCFQILDMDCKS